MTSRHTRPLTDEQRDGLEVSRWQAPDMGALGRAQPAKGAVASREPRADPPPERPRFPTADELEALRQAAQDEGFAQGRGAGYEEGLQEGRAAAKAEAERLGQRQQDELDHLEALLRSLGRPLAQLDEAVIEQLGELALTVARQVVRRELMTQPGEVMAVLRAAVAALPMSARNVRVHVNPEDFRFLTERLGDSGAEEDERAWRLVEDAGVSRGGCTVRSDASFIDATVEHRLNQLASQLLGGAREQDRGRRSGDRGEPGHHDGNTGGPEHGPEATE